jgi:hypothetical protein
MTEDTAATFNLDGMASETARDFLRRAAAETRHGPVWITENGERIAAIASKEAAESLARLRAALPVQDIEELLGPETDDDFRAFIEALRSLRLAPSAPRQAPQSAPSACRPPAST